MSAPPDSLAASLSSLVAAGSPGPIVRVWRARATPANVPAYLAHVTQRVFPALRATAGYRGGWVLQERLAGAVTGDDRILAEIRVFTLWESMEAVRSFAGGDASRAVVEPQARAVLAEYDETVLHFTLGAVDRMASNA